MVKGVADAKDKQSHQEDSHQQIEHDADLDDQRHAKGGGQSSQEDAVVQHQQADHLHQCLLTAHHEEAASQHQGDGGGEHSLVAAQHADIGPHRKKGEKNESSGYEHGLGRRG